MHTCPLCHSHHVEAYFEDKHRSYVRCQVCHLVFVPPAHRLSAEREKAFYDLHENNPHDLGYRRFLSRLCEPMLERLNPQSVGLDFGCGPGPTLSLMLAEAGHSVALYDHFFYPKQEVLHTRYDFMTASEVIEHLHDPHTIWQQWLNLVKPGGWIGLMTKLVKNVDAFAGWHYKNDLTHVSFFSRETFQFLAERDKLELEFIGSDVILLRNPQ
ncbi:MULTISPECIES: class I SAM-dependent methyltransferase [Vibrio]|uniref:class I SAM-dependent methyltransferase n=1 Tax=Vibrio TaxID=662 RepID=UPI00137349ED|nr:MULTISPECIES: class I SAM-dependent methyltransferase [Vibrio]